MTVKTFKKKGDDVVNMNLALIDAAVNATEEVVIPASLDGVAHADYVEMIPADADKFAKSIIEPSMRQKGDDIPVSAMSVDGVIPTGTAKLEKRGIAPRVPKWNSETCAQCGVCASACPHAAIRTKLVEPADAEKAPASFTMVDAKPNDHGEKFKVQVYCDDCTGCGVCLDQCPMNKIPGKEALTWSTIEAEKAAGESENEKFFGELPDNVMGKNTTKTIKGAMLRTPLFEFSGACAGCGETPYVKLVSQLFGENAIVANATGCSSIYSGTFPTIPYTTNKEGRGPAWANSLFEDNAEFGFGMQTAAETMRDRLQTVMVNNLEQMTEEQKALCEEWVANRKNGEKTLELKDAIEAAFASVDTPWAKEIMSLKQFIVKRSQWIIGGDGWAYDIGYGGLDHVIANQLDVNILVVDTEVYSNTGGQSSKSARHGSIAKFTASGKPGKKKDLAAIAMSYGHVYVATISHGANPAQVIKALKEAEAYDGPSIIIAYSPCIAHNIKGGLYNSQLEAKLATECGYFPLFRFNPDLALEGKNPLQMDSKEPNWDKYNDFLMNEGRYAQLKSLNPAEAEALLQANLNDAKRRYRMYQRMAAMDYTDESCK